MNKKDIARITLIVVTALVVASCCPLFDLCPPNPERIAVVGISIDQTSVSLSVGDTIQLSASVSPANATDKSITWSSSDSTTATTDDTGLVTGLAQGSTTITATTVDGGYAATITVNVQEQQLQTLISRSGNMVSISTTPEGASATVYYEISYTDTPPSVDSSSSVYASRIEVFPPWFPHFSTFSYDKYLQLRALTKRTGEYFTVAAYSTAVGYGESTVATASWRIGPTTAVVEESETHAYAYDSSGYLTSFGHWNLTQDSQGRLTTIADSSEGTTDVCDYGNSDYVLFTDRFYFFGTEPEPYEEEYQLYFDDRQRVAEVRMGRNYPSAVYYDYDSNGVLQRVQVMDLREPNQEETRLELEYDVDGYLSSIGLWDLGDSVGEMAYTYDQEKRLSATHFVQDGESFPFMTYSY